jgi:DUF1707 SHOCT-like domain/TM2 domain
VTAVTDPAGPDSLRIGTLEREDAVRVLGVHFVEGRLPVDEYQRRVDVALEARFLGDIRELFDDLPPPYPQVLRSISKGERLSDRNQYVAGLLQLLLPFGAGRFYIRDKELAVLQLITAFFVVGMVWCFVDGFKLLVFGGHDGNGLRLRSR